MAGRGEKETTGMPEGHVQIRALPGAGHKIRAGGSPKGQSLCQERQQRQPEAKIARTRT